MSGNISGMKPLVFNGDAVGGEAAVKVRLLAGRASFSRELDMTARRVFLANDGPQILEPQLSAVAKSPVRWLREVCQIGLRIEFGSGGLPLQLRQRERILP